MLYERIVDIISRQFEIDADRIRPETSFIDDLGADSLDIVELTMDMETEFDLPEVPEEELRKLVTVGDLVEYVSRFVQD